MASVLLGKEIIKHSHCYQQRKYLEENSQAAYRTGTKIREVTHIDIQPA